MEETRPRFVRIMLNPLPDVCRRVMLTYEPEMLLVCYNKPGWTEPATPNSLPYKREFC